MPAPSSILPNPTQAQMLAEAYRRNLMRPAQSAAYEAAALRGAVDDPYAAARADEKSSAGGAAHGASLTFTGSIPFLHEGGAAMAAGAGAVANMMSQRPPDFGGQWNRARATQQGYQDQFAADHPIGTAGLKTAGLAAQLAAAIGTGGVSDAQSVAAAGRTTLSATAKRFATAKRIATASARNATFGGGVAAVSAAGQPGTLRQRAVAADNAFLPGSVVGALTPALPASISALRRAGSIVGNRVEALTGRMVGRLAAADGFETGQAVEGQPPLSSAEQAQASAALSGAGIPLTLGQRFGGPVLSAENQASQLPYLGAAIRSARLGSREALNRALANSALVHIGQTLPARVPVGKPALEFVNSKIAAAREDAPDAIVSVEPDEQYANDVQNLLQQSDEGLPQKLRDHFSGVVSRTANKLGQGHVDGDSIRDIFYWLDGNIDDHIDSETPTEDIYSSHLQSFKDTIAALAGRQNPAFTGAYTGVEKAKLISNLLADATKKSGGDHAGFDAAHFLEAYDELPASHVSDLAESALQPTMDLANSANSIMGATLPSTNPAGQATLMTAGLGAAAVPNALSGRFIPNAFQIAAPAGVLGQAAPPNAFVPATAAGVAAAGGLGAAASAARSQRQPLVSGAP